MNKTAFFRSMRSSHKLLILLLVITISAAIAGFAVGGYLVAGAVSLFILALLLAYQAPMGSG
jgi:hypothetical protein